eukprot:CAMPEP_0172931128 /NCGR_PEP_ID=MMETSP1075-20121228/219340_1 /TAXON_ID=2916 /ORGANISM="Ceratium fusus, Strain PA161109" /LENGTH=319 /DNA_ID=CAMNT_0013792445 /DNA_START=24 /DNA_END=979 /DNA_ORIENTATION=+
MPVPSMKLASTIEPSGTDPGPLKRAQTEQWKSKVQTFELKGATLAVFSVHENHIVNSSSRQWVSDAFFYPIKGINVEFRVQFIAKQMAEGKKGHSFKKANGWGKMELKCAGEPVEGDRFKVAFLVGPGVKQYSSLRATAAATDETGLMGEAADPAKKIDRRETQSSHDFGKYPMLGLTGDKEFWDFGSLQDKKKQLIHIGVEMLPQKSASEHKPHEERGKMELKCAGEPVEGDRFKVAFLVGPGVKQYSLNATAATTDETVSMGETGDPAKKIDRRETQSSHDFGKYPLLGLPAEYEMWDFGSLQDKKKQLIHIGVEML